MILTTGTPFSFALASIVGITSLVIKLSPISKSPSMLLKSIRLYISVSPFITLSEKVTFALSGGFIVIGVKDKRLISSSPQRS